MTVKAIISTVAALIAMPLFSAASAPAATLEAPVTLSPAQSITATSATLEGELNPGSSSEKLAYDFEWNYGSECEGYLAFEPYAETEGNHVQVSTSLTGLEPSTRYAFCVFAENSAEESARGASVSFTTQGLEPAIEAQRTQSGSVTPFNADLEAEINPENEVGTYRFEYASSEAALLAEEGTIFGEGSLSAVDEDQTAGPAEIGGGLQPESTYYYRVVAGNRTGVSEGTIESFETMPLEKPAIEDEFVTAITQTTAQFFAYIDPEYQNTFCRGWQYVEEKAFDEHGFTGALEAFCGPEEIGGGGGFERVASSPLLLAPNTTYDYRVLGENASGTSDGPAATFSTLPYPPEALTGGASSITTTAATITGSVNPGSMGPNSATTYYFQYGTSTGYGSQTPLVPGVVGEGESAVPESASLTGLAPGTTYHYRIVATNDNANSEGGAPQSTYGQDQTFTTTATPPLLSGVAVQGVTQNAATITATLNPNGLASRYELQLGETPGLLLEQASGDTSTVTPISVSVASLTPGTTYYYKLIATNANGSSESEGSFTTAPGAAGSAPLGLPQLIPYATIAELDAREAKEDKHIHLSKKQSRRAKPKKRLKACKRDVRHAKKKQCERKARANSGR